MISSFFGKSKPINIVIVSVLVGLVFFLAGIFYRSSDFSLYNILIQLSFAAITIFTVFVVDFIINKNNLTGKTNYTILLFGLFIAILPKSVIETNILLSNVCVLFALRRLISLKSKLEIKKKLFDAGFWIALATLCYPGAILFFIVILIALVYYAHGDVKNVIVPFLGFLTVVLIYIAANIILNWDYFQKDVFLLNLSFDFSPLNTRQIIVGSSILISLFFWTIFYYIKEIQDKMRIEKASHVIIIVAAIIGLLIVILTPIKTSSEMLFFFFPLSVIVGNYLEKLKDVWFKETLFWILLLTPISLLLLNFFPKG